jgi:hypothetical protein
MSMFNNWSPYDKYVQAGMKDGQFLSGAFTVVCAGPPRLANMGGSVATGAALTFGSSVTDNVDLVYPIGVVQNVNLSHNRAFNRVFEIGSERSYFVSGRTMGQLGLSRVLYHGPSLLRTLYAYYADKMPPTIVDALYPNPAIALMDNPHDVILTPGFSNFFINLASDLFNQPIGLLLYIKDSNMETYGAVYLEGSYIPNHTWATDAQGVIIQESAAVQFERAIPVAVQAISLISGATSNVAGAAGALFA